MAKNCLKEFKLHILEKKLIFQEKYDSNIPPVLADPKLLTIVFQNLLSNAIKYTPEEGKIELSISLNNKKNAVLLKISDTGCGIPKDQQNKIFTKLFRADNAREKDTEGTGLGLYIAKAIIDHSGGFARFKSEENKGTTFYVTLPLADMKMDEDAKALKL